MKNESNTYNINNPDGSQGKGYDYKKLRFDNDDRNFIKENPIEDQGEFLRVAESFDDPKQPSQKKEKKREDQQQDFNDSSSSSSSMSSSSSASSSASSTASSSASSAASSASSAASAASSAASSVASGIGALAGTVATAVVAAAVIVVAVVNAFILNVSLLMSTESSFVFQVEMTGSEEDFLEPIYAILSGPDGTEQKRELQQGITNITFENLTSGEEYILRIRNSEKILTELSYVTPSESEEKGSILMRNERNTVLVAVENVQLKDGEYYTLVVKDAKSKVVLSKDGTEPSKEFTIPISEDVEFFATLSVNGNVYAVSQISVKHEKDPVPEIDPDPNPDKQAEFDLNNGVWEWSDDYSVAKISFARINGGSPLVVSAVITSEVTEPTCEEDGYTTYKANATYENHSFSDEKVVTDEESATGHIYGEPIFEWIESDNGYTAKAVFVCVNDETHTVEVDAIVTAEETPADCENDAVITYTATVELDGNSYSDENVVTVEESALGHSYGEPVFEWTEAGDNMYTVTATFTCASDETHQLVLDAVVTYVPSPALCVSDGYIIYTATVELDGNSYSDEKIVASEASALGHDYGNPVFEWTETSDGYTVKATFTCANDVTHKVVNEALVTVAETPAGCETDAYITYTATTDLNNVTYSEDKVVTIENTSTGHDYGEPSFEWSEENNLYTAKAICICRNNEEHRLEYEAEVGFEEDPADCEYDRTICYYASVVIGEDQYGDEKVVTYEGTALGHTYSNLIAETIADCEHEGAPDHYECLTCGKYFVGTANEKHEVSREEIFTPALTGITQLTSNNLSQDLIGRKVKIMTTSGSEINVLLGADGAVSTEDYTTFYIESVGNGSVVLYELRGTAKYYLSPNTGTITFGTTTPTAINVSDLSVEMSSGTVSTYLYILHGTSSIYLTNGKLGGMTDVDVAIYLLPSHTYGELITEVPADCEEIGMRTHYYCPVCEKYFDSDKNEVSEESLEIPATGHDYGKLVEATTADCEHDGNIAYYQCALCERYFNENKQEVSEESVFIPAMGVISNDLTKLTSENLSPNLIGKKVYLRTDDIEYLYGVKIGASNNTTNDMSDLTAFTIMDVDASNNSVILYCEETGGYLIVDEDANVDFTGTSRNAIRVWSDGSLDANHPTNGYSYEIKYDPWDGKGIYMSNMPTNDPHVYMYMIPTPGHDYGEPEFVWTQTTDDDGYGATAIFTCSVCMKSVAVEATVSRDGDFCYAEAEFNGEYYNAELQVGNGNYEIVGGLTVITADMLSGDMIDPSAHPSANLFDGFVEGNFTSVSNMQLDIEDLVYVIFAFDEEGFYICRFENGLCIDAEPNHDVVTTIENLLSMVNAGDTFYYTVGATNDNPSGGPAEIIPIEGLTAITADMLSGDMIDPSAHPSANLFDGFVESNWSTISNIQFDAEGTFHVIYAFDESGVYVCSFYDGVCAESETIYVEGMTNEDLLVYLNDGLRFYYISDESLSGGNSQTGGDSPSGEQDVGHISLSDGPIYIDPTGYARSRGDNLVLQNSTEFVSSETNPYIISGSLENDETLDIQNGSGSKQTIYLTFMDGTWIQGGSWSTAFRIMASSDIDIYIINEGTTTIKGGNHAAIELQEFNGVGGATVNVYVTSEGGFDTFICERQDGETPTIYDATIGTLNFYMNGVKQ